MGVGGIAKYLNAFMDADVNEKDRILKLMKETASIGEATARRSETLQQIELRGAAGERERQLHPSRLEASVGAGSLATTSAETARRVEDKEVNVDALILKELGKSREGFQALLEARLAQEGVAVSEAREGLDIAPEIARKDVAETRLAADTAEGQLEILPAQQRVERQLLEMQPTSAALDIQIKSQQIQTVLSERDPKLKLYASQIKLNEAQAAKATTVKEEDKFRKLKAFYELLWTVQANEYAKKVHGKTIEQLKVDEMMKEGELSPYQTASLYLSALDKSARMSDPMMLLIMKEYDIDPKSVEGAATDLKAFADNLKPLVSAAVKDLEEPAGAVPAPGAVEEPFAQQFTLGDGAIVPPVGPVEVGPKRPSPERAREIIEAGRKILPGGGTP